MHFHDSFIAHFFPVLSLSCCHKQTSAVLLLFIIHKSNKVASQDGARRHSRGVLHHSFLLLRSFVHIHFVPLSRGSILQPPPVFSCPPAVSADSRKWKRRSRGLCWLPSSKFLRAAHKLFWPRRAATRRAVGNVNQMSLVYIFIFHH
jgi:hypothetical protein